MKILGIAKTTKSTGETVTTLHLAEPFEAYYHDAEKGRTCEGSKTSTVYVGTLDCSALKIGQEVEIFYEAAKVTQKGTFQTVKKIEVVGKQ